MAIPDENQTLREEIEARKKTEAELRERMDQELRLSEAKFQAIFEAAPQAIVAVNREGQIVLVNRSAEKMFGYDRSEIMGQALRMLIPERLRPVHEWHRIEFLERPRTRAMGAAGMPLLAQRKDGSEFSAEIGISFVNTGDGVMAMAMVNDITSREQAAKQIARTATELRASEARLRSYLEAASQTILAISNDGRIVLVNHSTEQMFGYTREELLGQELEMLLPARLRGLHVAHRASYFGAPRMRVMGEGMDLAGRRKDGTEFPVEVGLSVVADDEGVMALGLVSDITERKHTMGQLAQVNAELRRSNAELEQFAYVASHDLQEPLRMVSSYLQLLARRYSGRLDADADEFIQYAVDGADRMKRLIDDLLNFSRMGTQAAHFQKISADTILKHALSNLKAAINESGASIVSEPLPDVVADSGLLAQVFQNLIGNAIKFQDRNRPEIHVSAGREGAMWVFAVKDNGIGVEPRHEERIFQIFQRLHGSEVYSGTGIGLAVSKKLVERHGGRIWLKSRPCEGSTFFFSVPAETGAPLNALAASAAQPKN